MPAHARPRIAFLTPYAVLPPSRGGRIRDHHLWRALSAFGEVSTFILGDSPLPPVRADLRTACVSIWPRRPFRMAKWTPESGVTPGLWEALGGGAIPEDLWPSLEQPAALLRHHMNPRRAERIVARLARWRPDLIILGASQLGLLLPELRHLGVPVVVSTHNHESALYAAMAEAEPEAQGRRWNLAASRAFAAAEAVFLPGADQIWVCSPEDLSRVSQERPRGSIHLIPNVMDVPELAAPAPTRDLVFVGNGQYAPNEVAELHLIRISRELDAMGVAHRMRLVGRTTPAIRAAALEARSVEVLGEVAEVAPILADAALVPVPLTLGGGTRLKILEAMAAGRPVLSTPIGIEGIGATDGVHAFVEPDLAAFPARIAGLLDDPEAGRRVAAQGWQLIRDAYSHEALLRRLGAALRELGLAAPPAAGPATDWRPVIRQEQARFNPDSRLLHWSFLLRIAAGFGDLVGRIATPVMAELPNAFVTLKRRPRGFVFVDIAAILPAQVQPEDLELELDAWDAPLMRRKPPVDLPRERALFLTLEPDGESHELIAWSPDPVAEIRPSGQVSDLPGGLPGLVVARLTEPAPAFIALRHGARGEVRMWQPGNWLKPWPMSSRRLAALRDRHAGETAWLVGNGPSVRHEDLDRLEGRLTFCFNRFHLAHSMTRLRATYTVTADQQMIEDFGQRIVDESGGSVFVAHHEPPPLIGSYIWVRQIPVFPPVFSLDPTRGVTPGGSSVFVAMQLAWWMGVRRFNLYGADFRFAFAPARRTGDIFRVASGDGNHFIPNYRDNRPWCPPSLRDIGTAFLTARRMAENEGGFVRNVTRGGILEVFERDDFDQALGAG